VGKGSFSVLPGAGSVWFYERRNYAIRYSYEESGSPAAAMLPELLMKWKAPGRK